MTLLPENWHCVPAFKLFRAKIMLMYEATVINETVFPNVSVLSIRYRDEPAALS